LTEQGKSPAERYMAAAIEHHGFLTASDQMFARQLVGEGRAVSHAVLAGHGNLVQRLTERRLALFEDGMTWLEFALRANRFSDEEEVRVRAYLKAEKANILPPKLTRSILRKVDVFRQLAQEVERNYDVPRSAWESYARGLGLYLAYGLDEINDDSTAERLCARFPTAP
jgi:hypothetical protein